jgi:hypothetical protein
MASQRVSTSIFLDKYHPKADGKCAVSIRITFDRKKKYYTLNCSLTPSEFEKVMGDKPRNEFKEIALKLQAYENKAFKIIEDLPFFSWAAFEKHFLSNRGAKDSVNLAFTDYSKQLREEGRIGTAASYECAQRSINKFEADAQFSDITPEFLRKYENWMINNGNSISTVGIYVRSLRTLFNAA